MFIRRGAGVLQSLAAVLAGAGLIACARGFEPVQQARVRGGDPQEGRELILKVGCGACHDVPGVDGPRGRVGPPLEGFARRSLIAGRIPNRPAELALWVRNAPAFDPETGMPPMPLTEEEASNVVAYLYTLDGR